MVKIVTLKVVVAAGLIIFGFSVLAYASSPAVLDSGAQQFPLPLETRQQHIRTISQMPFKAHIFDVQDLPLYQKLAPKVNELVQLDLKKKQVARALGISEKVVDRSLQWIKKTGTEYPILPQKERLELLRKQIQTLSNLRPYQRMGEEAYTLHQKGVTKLDIAKKFGVDWDTAHRAILWWEKMLKQLE